MRLCPNSLTPLPQPAQWRRSNVGWIGDCLQRPYLTHNLLDNWPVMTAEQGSGWHKETTITTPAYLN
ncbi:uncharacterized protein METZ01_LOCUS374745 [marine metagenome]|uniref:Uncharacterized protein n=1 Tax=marine metagenome TaxID=408172 RepID=A0A382TKC6_9ZZZZ